MKTTVHLVLNRRGVARMTKNKPDLARDEIAIGLRLSVPDSSFLAPIVFADLEVPESAVAVPEISVELDDTAQGMEAETAGETEGLDPKDDSPVAKPCAQPSSPSQ